MHQILFGHFKEASFFHLKIRTLQIRLLPICVLSGDTHSSAICSRRGLWKTLETLAMLVRFKKQIRADGSDRGVAAWAAAPPFFFGLKT